MKIIDIKKLVRRKDGHDVYDYCISALNFLVILTLCVMAVLAVFALWIGR